MHSGSSSSDIIIMPLFQTSPCTQDTLVRTFCWGFGLASLSCVPLIAAKLHHLPQARLWPCGSSHFLSSTSRKIEEWRLSLLSTIVGEHSCSNTKTKKANRKKEIRFSISMFLGRTYTKQSSGIYTVSRVRVSRIVHRQPHQASPSKPTIRKRSSKCVPREYVFSSADTFMRFFMFLLRASSKRKTVGWLPIRVRKDELPLLL